eukprot:CAMPEP_0178750426 /NCGR_PEP_ID=MMETSP0744-20121128/9974_1 /TAXON_ID=913974 /ORGANISM="Nitzschia punctata, Strain CCMP561" /LENGTH=363 /DNA_ID=CAMNT_0020403979 /DNA_START=128 /DNA_END=1215 /DNA_ORIENTATION=+
MRRSIVNSHRLCCQDSIIGYMWTSLCCCSYYSAASLLLLLVRSPQRSFGFVIRHVPPTEHSVVVTSRIGTSSSAVLTTSLDAVVSSSDDSSSSFATLPPGKASDDDNNNTTGTNTNIRPIHQNWWPVASLSSLDPTRPNPIELLNQKLVLFRSNSSASAANDNDDEDDKNCNELWTCLDDRCSHRFAPLSEGRVVPKVPLPTSNGTTASCGSSSCGFAIQCAYHGWEFDGNGQCTKIPQAPNHKPQRQHVQSYPTQVRGGMVFVWSDPDSYEDLGKYIDIPIDPVVEAACQLKGVEVACFMRDLPYGYELLGENLLDLSHLPFSHHSVGYLSRDLGGPLPFQMLKDSQKSQDGPLYEVEMEHA